jgi:hypothetical protein
MQSSRRLPLAPGELPPGGCGAMGAHHVAGPGHGGSRATDAHARIGLGDHDPRWLRHRRGSRGGPSADPLGKALGTVAAAVVAR